MECLGGVLWSLGGVLGGLGGVLGGLGGVLRASGGRQSDVLGHLEPSRSVLQAPFFSFSSAFLDGFLISRICFL